MNEKQEIFIREYLKDFNGTRAYKVAYPSCKKDETARVNASKLLTKTNIQTAIKEQANKQLKKIDVDVNDILRELKAIAFTDRTKLSTVKNQKLLEDNGREYYEPVVVFEDTANLDEETKKVIAGYKKTQSGFAIETYDKIKALELLGKYLGMFTETFKIENPEATKILSSISKQLGGKNE